MSSIISNLMTNNNWMNTNYWLNINNGLLCKMYAEFMGCMMFHFIGSVSPTPWANGISLMILVYFVAKISNGHLNPAVSTVFMLLGYINPIELLAYWIAQFAGCICGALWVWALIPGLYVWTPINSSLALAYSGCFIPKNGIDNRQIYGWEAVCTMCFILPIFSVVWYTDHKPGYGLLGPIMIGFSLLANAFAAGEFTGAALNPARAMASPVVFNCPDENKLYLYILGEMTAALLAPIILIPWYGLAPKPWYYNYVPSYYIDLFNLNRPVPTRNSNSLSTNNSLVRIVRQRSFVQLPQPHAQDSRESPESSITLNLN